MEISSDYYRQLFDWQATVEANRLSLLTSANEIIADWRTELQLDVISSEDKSSLVKWIAYIKDLKSMDFNSVTDEVSYKRIGWPVEPENI